MPAGAGQEPLVKLILGQGAQVGAVLAEPVQQATAAVIRARMESAVVELVSPP